MPYTIVHSQILELYRQYAMHEAQLKSTSMQDELALLRDEINKALDERKDIWSREYLEERKKRIVHQGKRIW